MTLRLTSEQQKAYRAIVTIIISIIDLSISFKAATECCLQFWNNECKKEMGHS